MVTRPTRAESISPKEKQTEYFSDFLNSFAKTPVGNQLGRVTNEKSVNQSLRNLIKTNLGERFFQPIVGSDVNASLFENVNNILLNDIEENIKLTIQNNEPRINLLEVSVQSSEISDDEVLRDFSGFLIQNNSISVTIVYNIINNPEEITLTTILTRVR
jgi:phage baseplate assembly protein W